MKHRLRLGKPGHVIFVSSICSKRSFRGLSIYSATKSAINSYSKSIAFEMGRKNIRSNVVVPGYMKTDMSSSLSPAQMEKIKRRCPMKRLAEIEEVCQVVDFLIQPNSFVNGAEFVVDGGYSL
jgi:3-oxoacyl-[acyl-carrier protein] reductase